MAIAILCDFVPVMFLLIFHFRNFNKKEEKEDIEEEVQQERGQSIEGYLDLDFVPESDNSSSAEQKQNDCQQFESEFSINRNDSCLAGEVSVNGLRSKNKKLDATLNNSSRSYDA